MPARKGILFSLGTRPLGTEVTGWVSFVLKDICLVHDHWARRRRGGFYLYRGTFTWYTTTGRRGDGVGFLCDGKILICLRERRSWGEGVFFCQSQERVWRG